MKRAMETTMEAGAKEAVMIADPVQFTYMDASTLYGDVKEIMIPVVASAMPKLAGWPADYPSIEGAIVQTDAPINAKGAYEGVKYNPKFAPKLGLEASKYRVRCVSYGLPKDGFAAGMAATIPYFSSPDPMMPEEAVVTRPGWQLATSTGEARTRLTSLGLGG